MPLGLLRRVVEGFPVPWPRVALCASVGALIGLGLTFWFRAENALLFMIAVWGGLLPLGLLGISDRNQPALMAAVGLAHGSVFFVVAFTVASIRFGRDTSPRFAVTMIDILIAAAVYAGLLSIPGDVSV